MNNFLRDILISFVITYIIFVLSFISLAIAFLSGGIVFLSIIIFNVIERGKEK